ncbi:CD3337/EF1877 family mobilome membrane protein [Enterococcus sp. BWR-S5]|uniref:CD3337/EF1877 family mobilome membrane protein n=1 Tax=Enterococcus sp. BWR-S5 TaxID=2787714 RepID=UPI00192371A1|nr:hypothetical protein [Enterococcus sp. BWR-S5]MBL1226505.1 hypothetical protein [Enterococcus sp. BWR-S5]
MDKFSVNSYMSLMNTEGSFWVIGDEKMYQLINFLINIGMVLNRWIYQLVDLSLQIFMSNTVFEDTIGSVFKVAVNLYSSLFSSLGTTLFIFALVSIFMIFTLSSPQEAFRKIVVLFAVIGINFVVYSRGEEYLNDVNGIFEEVETVMTSAIALPMFDNEGNQTELNAGAESSVDVMRETYFKVSMQQAFAMVNFGTPEYKKEFEKFLYTVDQENDENAKKDLKDNVREASEENRYLTPDGGLDKMFISAYAVVSNLFVGAPLLLIAVMKFLLKIIILCMVFGLPILSLLSLIPKFSNSIFNGIGKMMMVFFIGVFLSVAMYLFFFVMTLIDSSVIALAGVAGGATLVSCVLAAIVKGVTVFCIVKFRNQIVSFVTGGRVTNVNGMDRRMLRELRKNRKNSDVDVRVSNPSNADTSDNEESSNSTDLSDVDSRDYTDPVEIENWQDNVSNQEEQPDPDHTETNENRADTEKIDLEKDIEEEQEEAADLERIEVENDVETDVETVDPVEVLPADLEKLEVEEPEPVEVETENLDSLEAAEPPEHEYGDPDSVEVNNQVNHEMNDYSTLEEPPEVNHEEYYEELEMLRNE